MNKHKRSWLRLAPLALLAFGSFNQASMANEAVVIAGGTTPQKDVLEPKAEALAKATGVAIKVNGVGTGNGMVALWEGAVSIATVGDTLAASVEAGKKAAKAAGKDVKVPDNLVFTEIGKDELVIVVHKSNPVTSLSKAQLKDMASGKITNWKEVGGADLPIKVVTTKAGLVPGQFFQKLMMDDAAYVAGAIEAQSPKEVITWVSRTAGGFGPAADVHLKAGAGDTKTVKAPPMVRPLALVTIGQPTGAAKKVVDFYKSN
jgi:phosphate transport system substrate-binding protein